MGETEPIARAIRKAMRVSGGDLAFSIAAGIEAAQSVAAQKSHYGAPESVSIEEHNRLCEEEQSALIERQRQRAANVHRSPDCGATGRGNLFGADAHGQPGFGQFPDSCGWPNEQCIGHAPHDHDDRRQCPVHGCPWSVCAHIASGDHDCTDPTREATCYYGQDR